MAQRQANTAFSTPFKGHFSKTDDFVKSPVGLLTGGSVQKIRWVKNESGVSE